MKRYFPIRLVVFWIMAISFLFVAVAKYTNLSDGITNKASLVLLLTVFVEAYFVSKERKNNKPFKFKV